MKKVTLIIACVIFSLVCQSAFGTVIGINDFSGTEEVVTFDPGNGSGWFPSPYTISTATSDVTITSLASISDLRDDGAFGAFAATPGSSQGRHLSDYVSAEPSDLVFEFSNPLFRTGMWLNGGAYSTSWEVSILDQSDLIIESAIFNYGGSGYPRPSVFVGFESLIPIAKLRIVEQFANNQYTNIDDVRMEVPEPGTMLMLGLGAFVLRRKRTA